LSEEENITYIFKDNDEKELEKFVGIESYSTPEVEGIGGIYKNKSKDFIVKEITNDGKVLEIKEDYQNPPFSEEFKDKFTTFNLVKINKNTIDVINLIAKLLGISSYNIHYSGLKDKNSISVQKVSIRGNHVDKLKKVKIRDIFIRNIIPTKKSVSMGSHWGNNFTITIRNIENKNNLRGHVEEIIKTLIKKGFPNYFGLQRFGSFRPNSHMIGRYILEGNYEKAFNEFVITTYSTESQEARMVRNNLKNSGDLERAFNEFPKSLYWEKLMIKHLMDNDGGYKGAINKLPFNLKKLLISAYQSFIYNKALSLRVKNGLSFFEPVKGDVVSILDDINGQVTKIKYIYNGLYDKYLDEAIKLNRAAIIVPIVGFNTDLNDFPLMKTFFDKVIKQERVDIKFFNNRLLKENSFKGSFKPIIVKPIELKILRFKDDDLYPGKMKLTIEFSLPKGTYATMLLRELIK